jgi:release factor glutamine methyltransferase
MKTPKQILAYLQSKITAYPLEEAREIGIIWLQKVLDISKTDINFSEIEVDENSFNIEETIQRLNQNEPIQYILGEAWFRDRPFVVNKNVLIPRPETEEIIDLIKAVNPKTILDLGTGSGCIPISLALEIPNAQVYAIDISEGALQVATQNKANLKANVNFKKGDILNFVSPFEEQKFDVIVSNPPYVKNDEKTEMRANVLAFEPHLALFVENEDPLLFYRHIAQIGLKYLNENGFIVVEINSYLGKETKACFESYGYLKVELIQDFLGRDRFIKINR